MFELYERGYTSLFEQLISCIISIRTLDETTIPVSLRLFDAARTPEALLKLPPPQLENLLYGCTFPSQKAHTMLGIAKAAVEQYNGTLPADFEALTALKVWVRNVQTWRSGFPADCLASAWMCMCTAWRTAGALCKPTHRNKPCWPLKKPCLKKMD